MDLPAHALLAYILAKKVGVDPVAAAAFGVMPDIVTLPFFTAHRHFSLKGFTYFETSDEKLDKKLERVNFLVRGIPFALLASLVVYFFLKPLFLPFIVGYFSHFIADFLTHADKWSLKLFYPFSGRQFPGFFSWYERKNVVLFLCVEYSLLLTMALTVFS